MRAFCFRRKMKRPSMPTLSALVLLSSTLHLLSLLTLPSFRDGRTALFCEALSTTGAVTPTPSIIEQQRQNQIHHQHQRDYPDSSADTSAECDLRAPTSSRIDDKHEILASKCQDYTIPNRRIQYKHVEWSGSALPMQIFSAPKSVKQAPNYKTNLPAGRKPASPNDNDVDLSSISIEELQSMNLSKSSHELLKRYSELSERQQRQLIQKIRAEHRASQPLDPNLMEILYCDEHICVTNKPSGILSVPGPRRNPSLANLLYDALQPTDLDSVDQMIVHRLDMATSGIIVYALTRQALCQLHLDFKQRNVIKIYHALLPGHLDDRYAEGEIDVTMERDPNNPPYMRVYNVATADLDKETPAFSPDHKFFRESKKTSQTTYRVLRRHTSGNDPMTRIELKPWTGRTHQLRVHCAQVLGYPILGDEIYRSEDLDIPLCLHAHRLCINHPISGAPMIFQVDPPF